MKLICPECKNEVDLSAYPDMAKDDVIECDKCGISLQIIGIEESEAFAEVVDEGK